MTVKVVVFSGGRGSEVLSRELLRNPQVELTLAINGYDDGGSTGEVRRFLGDSLGPSDYRKNASRLARELSTCELARVDLLDLRLPAGCAPAEAREILGILRGQPAGPSELAGRVAALRAAIAPPARETIARWLAGFEQALDRAGRPFSFSDASMGNLVFAGGYLERGRSFNAAVADYCALLGLPPGMIENVSDGANAHLVAIDGDGRLLATEEEIVDGSRRRRIAEIFLIDRSPGGLELERLNAGSAEELRRFLDHHERPIAANADLLRRIEEADLIISAPGTQHSSLFPSYLTPGIGEAIARNLKATKLLITNLREDAEIGESSAVDIINRAVYYLRGKGRLGIPVPCLVTHYLINDPGRRSSATPYVPLGRLETLDDPRLIRIGRYEDGISGRHDAAAVLTPYVRSLLTRGARPRIAVLLLDASSPNLLCQSLLEMLRGGIGDLSASFKVFYESHESLDEAFVASLPFEVRNAGPGSGERFTDVFDGRRFDYVLLFESTGRYRGEDVVNVASLLSSGRLDAIWGSRRLSLRDIRESYRTRYRNRLALGAISYVGSHVLSLAYLFLYGRYVSDTLSGVRAFRVSYLRRRPIDLGSKLLNHEILTELLAERASLFETPVQFYSMSPERIRGATIPDGLRALATIITARVRRGRDAAGHPIATSPP
jgi:2-phospho-L-lactate transferase/gluconeogenesis factor (CofD/UPF0052 family)